MSGQLIANVTGTIVSRASGPFEFPITSCKGQIIELLPFDVVVDEFRDSIRTVWIAEVIPDDGIQLLPAKPFRSRDPPVSTDERPVRSDMDRFLLTTLLEVCGKLIELGIAWGRKELVLTWMLL